MHRRPSQRAHVGPGTRPRAEGGRLVPRPWTRHPACVQMPFTVITLTEVAIVSLERVGFNLRNLDMAVVFKDLARDVFRIDAIPSTALDNIRVRCMTAPGPHRGHLGCGAPDYAALWASRKRPGQHPGTLHDCPRPPPGASRLWGSVRLVV